MSKEQPARVITLTKDCATVLSQLNLLTIHMVHSKSCALVITIQSPAHAQVQNIYKNCPAENGAAGLLAVAMVKFQSTRIRIWKCDKHFTCCVDCASGTSHVHT